jgi:hypothetical protein
VYGMLGLGLMLFCLRAPRPGPAWKDCPLKFSFWAINWGLALMVLLSVLPVGLLQAWASLEYGMWYARPARPGWMVCSGPGYRPFVRPAGGGSRGRIRGSLTAEGGAGRLANLRRGGQIGPKWSVTPVTASDPPAIHNGIGDQF